jgi:hypothetical protein
VSLCRNALKIDKTKPEINMAAQPLLIQGLIKANPVALGVLFTKRKMEIAKPIANILKYLRNTPRKHE